MKCFIVLLIAILSFSGLLGCSTNAPRLPPAHESGKNAGPSVLVKSYKMAVGDQLQINVWKSPELSLGTPIRPDGKISMPLIGDVLAVGLTPEELAARIENRLANYVKAPNVTIILTNLQGQAFLSRIRVTGSVTKNISMTYYQGMTVLDAILEAGSIELYADENNTKLHRKTENGAVTYDIRLKNILEDGDMTTNIWLLPGDVITVPERSF
ncbi:MAG: sugar ABC transporter substrate-binding protein [Thiotrichaceae bacterium]|nr:MAG: sugar ABC transporter substrate-binding protein [Thiotrichaceae bacterium]